MGKQDNIRLTAPQHTKHDIGREAYGRENQRVFPLLPQQTYRVPLRINLHKTVACRNQQPSCIAAE